MSQVKFKRYNFSLTESVSKDIDEISFYPRDFKCSRSHVIKAAISSFKLLPKSEQMHLLKLESTASQNTQSNS